MVTADELMETIGSSPSKRGHDRRIGSVFPYREDRMKVYEVFDAGEVK